jgi:hypothetical protein
MESKFEYIKQADRKKILLLCDDIRMHSGIATMAREFVVKSAHHFNWFNLGAAVEHPEKGKLLDISGDVNKALGIEDASVKILPNNGYGDSAILRALLKQEKPDAIFIFTDPRYWVWLFEIEREIRTKIPIFWLNIWDDYPSPMYNKTYYSSVDVLMAISKQTRNINRLVLGEEANNKLIEYVPHGIDDRVFFPIRENHDKFTEFVEFKKNLFNGEDKEFVVFFNSRNIHRKHAGDTILAYKFFCDMIGEEKAKKCALVMHTQPVDQHGTDLRAVKDALTDPEVNHIYFSQDKLNPAQMNLLYNVADLTVLLTSNEGWGLSLTESVMAGTMIAANVTGGMQDQMRFVNEKGEWIDFDADFPSNHRGTYKECGEWGLPIFPTNISLAGSVPTPYIFDDRCSPEDAAKAMLEAYSLSKEERDRRGEAGREWMRSEEAQMSASRMAENIIGIMNRGFKEFKPRKRFDVIKVEDFKTDRVKHKLTGY